MRGSAFRTQDIFRSDFPCSDLLCFVKTAARDLARSLSHHGSSSTAVVGTVWELWDGNE